jgi:hypothetical protein
MNWAKLAKEFLNGKPTQCRTLFLINSLINKYLICIMNERKKKIIVIFLCLSFEFMYRTNLVFFCKRRKKIIKWKKNMGQSHFRRSA